MWGRLCVESEFDRAKRQGGATKAGKTDRLNISRRQQTAAQTAEKERKQTREKVFPLNEIQNF